VYQAYLHQFSEDFNLFLKSRAEELVHGGGMVLTFVGRDETSDIITVWGLIGLVLNDMVLEVQHRYLRVNFEQCSVLLLFGFFVSCHFSWNHNFMDCCILCNAEFDCRGKVGVR